MTELEKLNARTEYDFWDEEVRWTKDTCLRMVPKAKCDSDAKCRGTDSSYPYPVWLCRRKCHCPAGLQL